MGPGRGPGPGPPRTQPSAATFRGQAPQAPRSPPSPRPRASSRVTSSERTAAAGTCHSTPRESLHFPGAAGPGASFSVTCAVGRSDPAQSVWVCRAGGGWRGLWAEARRGPSPWALSPGGWSRDGPGQLGCGAGGGARGLLSRSLCLTPASWGLSVFAQQWGCCPPSIHLSTRRPSVRLSATCLPVHTGLAERRPRVTCWSGPQCRVQNDGPVGGADGVWSLPVGAAGLGGDTVQHRTAALEGLTPGPLFPGAAGPGALGGLGVPSWGQETTLRSQPCPCPVG